MGIKRSALALLAAAAIGVLLAAASSTPAHAEFAIAVAPPRFELEAKPGEHLRRTLEISNAGGRTSNLSVKTADWVYRPDGAVDFVDALASGSCRPWVVIERREVVVAAGRSHRFRF